MVAFNHFTPFHKSCHLIHTDRSVSVAIHTDIHRSAANVRQIAVAVSVQHPRPTVHLVPHSHCIVTHYDSLLVDSSTVNFDFVIMRDLVPPWILRDFIAVVISDNQPLLTIQFREDAVNQLRVFLAPRQRKIAQMVNRVAGFYFGIPPMDDRCGHLVQIFKRSLGVFDDVRMVEMRVACEPDRHVTMPCTRSTRARFT